MLRWLAGCIQRGRRVYHDALCWLSGCVGVQAAAGLLSLSILLSQDLIESSLGCMTWHVSVSILAGVPYCLSDTLLRKSSVPFLSTRQPPCPRPRCATPVPSGLFFPCSLYFILSRSPSCCHAAHSRPFPSLLITHDSGMVVRHLFMWCFGWDSSSCSTNLFFFFCSSFPFCTSSYAYHFLCLLPPLASTSPPEDAHERG